MSQEKNQKPEQPKKTPMPEALRKSMNKAAKRAIESIRKGVKK